MNKVLVMMLAALVFVGSTHAFAEDVYATKNGKRYHKADCLLIKDKGAKPMSLEDAQKKGLKPCKRCFGKTDAPKDAPAAKADEPATTNNTTAVAPAK